MKEDIPKIKKVFLRPKNTFLSLFFLFMKYLKCFFMMIKLNILNFIKSFKKFGSPQIFCLIYFSLNFLNKLSGSLDITKWFVDFFILINKLNKLFISMMITLDLCYSKNISMYRRSINYSTFICTSWKW